MVRWFVLKIEFNLQIALFFNYHKIHTSRTVDCGDITVPVTLSLRKQREIEAYKESKTEALTINLKDVLKTFEYFIQYLQGMIGGSGVTLSYIVRASNELHPKPEVDDPVTA